MEENKEEMSEKASSFAGQAAEKASQFAGQAKEMLSRVDTEKAMGATSKFMDGVFKFGKIVSALFMLLCIATMVLSILYALFKGSESLQVPDFNELVSVVESDTDGSVGTADDLAEKQQYRKIRDSYRKKIDAIVDLYRLDAKGDTDDLVQELCEIPDSLRSTYVKGALRFGDAAKKHFAKKGDGRQISPQTLDLYNTLFGSAAERAEESIAEAQAKKQVAWMVCGMAFLGLIMFMFLPLLIKIEENTRK
ncbi:MAG: hypothetical protein IKQ55_06630 [Kiritimatiellae bacterium]|nr:hypothetical protein [Kiritimatiellia bacterium]